jgi:hypothetical protein
MVLLELSDTESEIVKMLRQARPRESIKVTKDKDGNVDSFFIERIQKVVILKGVVVYQ